MEAIGFNRPVFELVQDTQARDQLTINGYVQSGNCQIRK